MNRVLAAALSALLLTPPASAETLRVATWHADLSRRGPGLLLRDILSDKDPQIDAVVAIIAATSPDVILLTGIDWDHGLAALRALEAQIARHGAGYDHLLALRPNSGVATGLDLNGDRRLGGPRDAQGYGRFLGDSAMALLSRMPILEDEIRDFTTFLWRDLPGGLIDGAELSVEATAIQRLSSTGHWDVPLRLPNGDKVHLLAYQATPPVFDGPEDRNGRRNHDETAFWLRYLDGVLPWPAPAHPFIILGDANLDPIDGEGRHEALRALLADPRLQDPTPRSIGAAVASTEQGGPNLLQLGDPAMDTVDWDETYDLGNRRVDFVLPSAALVVVAAGVVWPEPGAPLAELAQKASRHKLVWVDIAHP